MSANVTKLAYQFRIDRKTINYQPVVPPCRDDDEETSRLYKRLVLNHTALSGPTISLIERGVIARGFVIGLVLSEEDSSSVS